MNSKYFIVNMTKFKALTFIYSVEHVKSNYWGVHRIKSILLIFITSLIFSCTTNAQPYTSNNNYSGLWSSSASWDINGVPPTGGTKTNGDVDIYGYITHAGDLSFANSSKHILTVYDTLVVNGNLTFGNQSMDLVIPTGGVLIVLGDFTADNKITVGNGGILVVTGNMTFSNSGQDTYDDNGGDLFVNGTVSGNDPADAVDQNFGVLQSTYPDIYDFVEGNGTTPLPITLKEFSAIPNGNEMRVEWITTSELNNNFFTVERSRDGLHYEVIGTVKGKGTTNEVQEYVLMDKIPLIGYSYYRLKQTDLDGTTEIFDPVSIFFNGFTSKLNIYPNPVRDGKFSLSYQGLEHFHNISIQLNDLNGKVVFYQEIKLNMEDFFQKQFELNSSIPIGVYVLTLQMDGQSAYARLVID